MTLIYLDTETTGLDPTRHEVWEIAFARQSGPVQSEVVSHVGISADPKALEIGGYHARAGYSYALPRSAHFENDVFQALQGNTLVGANPAFDAAFLKARWGSAPWKYRLLDIEAYAMGALGYDVPHGLKGIAEDLRNDHGADIPHPDHTASGDVATLRACHLALVKIYQGCDR